MTTTRPCPTLWVCFTRCYVREYSKRSLSHGLKEKREKKNGSFILRHVPVIDYFLCPDAVITDNHTATAILLLFSLFSHFYGVGRFSFF